MIKKAYMVEEFVEELDSWETIAVASSIEKLKIFVKLNPLKTVKIYQLKR